MQVKSVGKISQGISQPNKRHIIFYNIPRTSYRYAKLEEAKFAIVEGKGAIVGRVVFFFFFRYPIANKSWWLTRNDNLNNDSRLPRIQLLNNWRGGVGGEGMFERALEERGARSILASILLSFRPDSLSRSRSSAISQSR